MAPKASDNARTPSPVEARAPGARPDIHAPSVSATTSRKGTPVRAPAQSHTQAKRVAVAKPKPPPKAHRPFDPTKMGLPKVPWRVKDHRYARPHWKVLRPHPRAPKPPPAVRFYRPWYSHWWLHPYWRHVHATVVVVDFGFVVHPWWSWWVPPTRPGWVWVPGYWAWGVWHPGHWRPVRKAPVYRNITYVYVPGWWQGEVYVEGYYRPDTRDDGDWAWVEGYYLDDGTYVPGHWRPAGHPPEGYVWEPGFFDGETWVGGFWRPEYHAGHVWVSSWFDDDGIYHCGYWEPLEDRPGEVWVPGWFDGTQWIAGQWVPEADYEAADPETWEPEAGWDDGWEAEESAPTEDDALPLALPVEIEAAE